MKNISILFLLALITLATSCGDDDAPLTPTTTVNLNIKGVYENDPLVMIDKIYKYPDGRQVFFNDVEFFISDVVLIEADGGNEIPFLADDEVEFVSFSQNNSEADAAIPVSFSKNLIPAGEYSGLKISFGVPADLNNEEANQFGENNPLRQHFDKFWSGWQSFIFTTINGQYDVNGDGVFDGTDAGFNHHIGSDAMFRTVTITKAMSLEEGQPFDLDLMFDLQRMYGSTSDHLDMTNPDNWKTHSATDLSVAEYMVPHYQDAIFFEK